MKKLIFYLCLCIGLCVSCSEDTSVDYTFQVVNLTAEAREGAIKLNWELPQDSNLLYVRIDYYNIRQKKDYVVNKSVFADSLVVDGLLARDGAYTFRLTAVNANGQESALSAEVSCTCLPVQPVITTSQKEVDADMVHYETNAQEPTGWPLDNLFDGDYGTFFHTPWTIEIGWPQWVEIEVSQPINGITFYTINRDDNGSGIPGFVEILASNNRETWTKLYEFSGTDDIPNIKNGRYDSPLIYDLETHYKYFRYNVTEGNGGNSYWNMAEMAWTFYEVTQTVYDPENETD